MINGIFFLISADTTGGSDTKLTVEDLFKPEFEVHDPEPRWMSGEELQVLFSSFIGSFYGLLSPWQILGSDINCQSKQRFMILPSPTFLPP